ncbi:hypothetical protein ACLNGM_17525 [Aureimonas phyllosphaerae]|uniref:hypothetical protein n=1 Tax=Aureimonas phyllosphaerae TaxID=1166078 RepID=UPI003A5BDD67
MPVRVDGTRLWVPPKSSRGSRRPPTKNVFSVRGVIIDPATNREIVYESTLERDLLCILLADRRVASLLDQPPAVEYFDDTGRIRRHTLDFMATLRDGRRIWIAVKPQARVISSGIEETLERIGTGPSRHRADAVVLRTDRHISRDRAADARMILRARRTRVARDVEAVAEWVRRTNGRISVDAICNALPDIPAVFMRIVNLVDEGVLRPVGTGRLSMSTSVRHIGAPAMEAA